MSKDLKPCVIPPSYFSTLPSCSDPAAMSNSSFFPQACAFALAMPAAWRTKDEARCEKCPEVSKTIDKLLQKDERWSNCFWLMLSDRF